MKFQHLSKAPRVVRGALLLAFVLASLLVLLPFSPAVAVPLGKSLCDPPQTGTLGTPCTVQGAGPYTTVHYKIELDNTGGPVTTANLSDPFPTGFHPVSVTCTSVNINPNAPVIPVLAGPPSASTLAATVPMQPNEKVECVVAGYFDSSGQSWSNQAQSGTDLSNQLNTTIQQTLLLTDISIGKNCTPTSVNVTGGPQTVHCTIVITNNGPKDAFLGGILHLEDDLALTANGVPLSITPVGATTCAASPTSANGIPVDCLNGQVTAGAAPLNSNYVSYFTWGYAAGTPGYLPVNGTMTVDYTMNIQRSTNITCVKDLNPAGFLNQAKIVFTPPTGTQIVDTNAANNESSVTTITVNTGVQTVDPLCGSALSWAPFTITKTLKSTQPSGGFGWGNAISYEITITNITNQTLNNIDVSDWSMDLAGTPPYFADTVSWFPPDSGSDLGPTLIPGYNSIGQIWKGQISLGPNASYTFLPFVAKYDTKFCDSFQNGANPIRNVFRGQWTGKTTPPNSAPITQTWYAEGAADVLMANRPPCKFSVVKLNLSSPNKIVFGQWFKYRVKFTNPDPVNVVAVGTIADRLRIVPANYATSMQADYAFNCPVVNGMIFQPLTGGGTKILTYAQQPHQGIDLLTTPYSFVVFPPNTTLTCDIQVRLQRPAKGDPYCMGAGEPQIENIALMDSSQTYGPTVAWPPSGAYNPALTTIQPIPMGSQNWASVRTDLPHCFNLQVNKSVAPQITWVTNPTPTVYTIDLHNFGDTIPLAPFNLSGTQWPNWAGPQLQDFFTQNPPTAAVTSAINPANCFLGLTPQCVRLGPPVPPPPAPPLPGLGPFPTPPFHIGIEGIAHNQDIVLSFKVSPVCKPAMAKNEVIVFWSGPNANTDWYSNDDRSCFGPPPLVPPYSSVPTNNGVIGSCSRVQQKCLQVGKLEVVKDVVNTLGVPTPANFGMTVNCTPFGSPAPSAPNGPLTLNTPISVPAGGSTTISNIPETSICTVIEPLQPSITNVAACGGASAYWSTVIAPLQPVTIVANQTAIVTVTNTLTCDNSSLTGSLTVSKTAFDDGYWITDVPFTVNVACIPNGPNSTLILGGSNNMQQTVPGIPVGSVCTITEAPPPSNSAMGWITTYPMGTTVTIQQGNQSLQVLNADVFSNNPSSLTVAKDVIVDGQGRGNMGPFYVQLTCTNSNNVSTTQNLNLDYTLNQGMFNTSSIAVGDTCSVTETPLPTVPASYANRQCHWDTTYWSSNQLNGALQQPIVPGSSVYIQYPIGTAELLVRNELKCVLPP